MSDDANVKSVERSEADLPHHDTPVGEVKASTSKKANNVPSLKFYRLHDEVVLPKFHTEQAACFDLVACFAGHNTYKGYDQYNSEFEREIHTDGRKFIYMNPLDRILVPTGLIMDIPAGYSVRLHPRSGSSFRNSLVLANSEGVIDSDYFHEVGMLVANMSMLAQKIYEGDRVAQAEMVPVLKYTITETKKKPEQKTSRKGGLGSTGVGEN